MVKKRVFAPGEEEKPSNIPLIAIGLGILWFGWLGDNPGNAMHANGIAAQAFVNTFIAGGLAMAVWMFTDWVRTGKVEHDRARSRVCWRASWRSRPAPATYPRPRPSFISLAAGWICYGAVLFRKHKAWDDSLDVWGVHGVGGLLGSILVGWFAYGSVAGVHGLMDGDPRRFGLQIGAAAITVSFTFVRHLRDLQGHRPGRQPRGARRRAGPRAGRGVPRRDCLRPGLGAT